MVVLLLQHTKRRDDSRGIMQDTHVSFRANEAVVAALSHRAAQAGCSLSGYLRSLVGEKVGLQ